MEQPNFKVCPNNLRTLEKPGNRISKPPLTSSVESEVEIVKKVYILSRGSIFLEGIETLLSGEEEFTIVGSHSELPTVECIQSCNPDVIIINLDDPEPELSPALLCVLKERLGISIVGLSLRDNKICIYRGDHKQIFQVEDLYKAILE